MGGRINLLKGSTFRLLNLCFCLIFYCSLGHSFEEVKRSLKGIVAEDKVNLGEVKINRDPLGFSLYLITSLTIFLEILSF